MFLFFLRCCRKTTNYWPYSTLQHIHTCTYFILSNFTINVLYCANLSFICICICLYMLWINELELEQINGWCRSWISSESFNTILWGLWVCQNCTWSCNHTTWRSSNTWHNVWWRHMGHRRSVWRGPGMVSPVWAGLLRL